MGVRSYRDTCMSCNSEEKAYLSCVCSDDRLLCADCVNSHQAIGHRVVQPIDIRQLPVRTLGLRKGKLRDSSGAKTAFVYKRIYHIYFFSMNQRENSLADTVYNSLDQAQWVWMDASVFGCGCESSTGTGKYYPQIVFEIEREGTITQLPKMLKSRSNRALWWHSAEKQY